jgi:hypothetical protein
MEETRLASKNRGADYQRATTAGNMGTWEHGNGGGRGGDVVVGHAAEQIILILLSISVF